MVLNWLASKSVYGFADHVGKSLSLGFGWRTVFVGCIVLYGIGRAGPRVGFNTLLMQCVERFYVRISERAVVV